MGDYCPSCACLYVSAYVLGMKPDTAQLTFSFGIIFKAHTDERGGEEVKRRERQGEARGWEIKKVKSALIDF